MNLRHLRAFVEVAHQSSFRRAAERLFVSQPALTTTINQFESVVGVSLFNRTTRRVDLTADGEDFLPVAERLLGDFDRAIADLQAAAERRGGQVAIAVLPSLTMKLVPAAVGGFEADNSGVRVVLRDDNARGVQRQVRDNESDFGISNPWRPDPALEYTPLTRDPVGVVCPADHPLAESDAPLTWAELEPFRFVGMSRDTGVHQLIHAVDGCPECVRAPEYEVLTMVALAGILEARLAITVLPALAVPGYMNSTLVFRALTAPAVERELCIITRRDYPLSEAAGKVRDAILAAISAPVA